MLRTYLNKFTLQYNKKNVFKELYLPNGVVKFVIFTVYTYKKNKM